MFVKVIVALVQIKWHLKRYHSARSLRLLLPRHTVTRWLRHWHRYNRTLCVRHYFHFGRLALFTVNMPWTTQQNKFTVLSGPTLHVKRLRTTRPCIFFHALGCVVFFAPDDVMHWTHFIPYISMICSLFHFFLDHREVDHDVEKSESQLIDTIDKHVCLLWYVFQMKQNFLINLIQPEIFNGPYWNYLDNLSNETVSDSWLTDFWRFMIHDDCKKNMSVKRCSR